MILRLAYLASSVFTLAAASKAGKTPGTPSPTDASKAGKSSPAPTYFPTYYSMSYSMSTPSPSESKSGKGNTPPISKSGKGNTPPISKSGKGKTSDEYFIAPFSCPGSCISAEPYELSSHLLDGAVTQCDASNIYQKWKVHQVDGLLKFESAAQYDTGMCLAVVHQDDPEGLIVAGLGIGIVGALLGGLVGGLVGGPANVESMCNNGHLGLAPCDHLGSYWYNTGGNLLSALCWGLGNSTAMSVDGCTADSSNVVAVDTSGSGALSTAETFMLLGY